MMQADQAAGDVARDDWPPGWITTPERHHPRDAAPQPIHSRAIVTTESLRPPPSCGSAKTTRREKTVPAPGWDISPHTVASRLAPCAGGMRSASPRLPLDRVAGRIAMECVGRSSTAVCERSDLTAQGYRRFRCRDCGKQFNQRSDSVFSRASLPSDIAAFRGVLPAHIAGCTQHRVDEVPIAIDSPIQIAPPTKRQTTRGCAWQRRWRLPVVVRATAPVDRTLFSDGAPRLVQSTR